MSNDTSTAPQAGLARDCLAYIAALDYVSFAELERWLEARDFTVAGGHCLELAPGVVIWAGVSEQFCDLVRAMRPHLELVPCSSLLVYLVDGKSLTLPLARRVPRNGYKNPHWLPVTLRRAA